VINGEFCIAGWIQWEDGFGQVESYDPAVDGWTVRAAMPTARYGPGGAVVNGLLYVAGGFNTSATPLSTLQAYDPATNSWKTLSSMPGARGISRPT
jgi:N-acetylneuraminic acid mutarotase